MCRAALPIPTHAVNQVIIPVPVAIAPTPVPKWRIFVGNFIFIIGVGGLVAYVTSPYFSRH